MKDINRRRFLKAATILPLVVNGGMLAASASVAEPRFRGIRFGICTDVHQDLIPDAEERLAAFIKSMKQNKPDFIIQLGDFCFPEETNREFMRIWNSFPGPKLHVIGNHDPEGDRSIESVMRFWGMEHPYYSTDINGYHIVVLNANDQNPEHETPWRYERYISKNQLDWLESDLESTSLPTMIFTHQALDNPNGVENAFFVRALLERINKNAGFRKVQLVFSGHHHLDYHNVINGIHYIQINSMSYNWQGNEYAQSPYPESVNAVYPLLKYMAHYKEPLWATVDIEESGRLVLTGKRTQFLGSSPEELGMPRHEYGHPVVAKISDRKIQLSLSPFSAKDGF